MLDVLWAMCGCYVWPTTDPAMPGSYIGRCGRCDEGARQLSFLINTKEEAVEVFFENYHRYPTPI